MSKTRRLASRHAFCSLVPLHSQFRLNGQFSSKSTSAGQASCSSSHGVTASVKPQQTRLTLLMYLSTLPRATRLDRATTKKPITVLLISPHWSFLVFASEEFVCFPARTARHYKSICGIFKEIQCFCFGPLGRHSLLCTISIMICWRFFWL